MVTLRNVPVGLLLAAILPAFLFWPIWHILNLLVEPLGHVSANSPLAVFWVIIYFSAYFLPFILALVFGVYIKITKNPVERLWVGILISVVLIYLVSYFMATPQRAVDYHPIDQFGYDPFGTIAGTQLLLFYYIPLFIGWGSAWVWSKFFHHT